MFYYIKYYFNKIINLFYNDIRRDNNERTNKSFNLLIYEPLLLNDIN